MTEFRGAVVQLVDGADPMRSDVTLLAAALLTLGIPVRGKCVFNCVYERVRGSLDFHSIWTFGGASKCGRFDAKVMELSWSNHAWLTANPTHPLAILRGGLTYHRALTMTPRFSLDELARIETPDTWIEAGARNLVMLLRLLPRAAQKGVVRFGETHMAFVPRQMPEAAKSTFLRYTETKDPEKRRKILEAS